MAGKPGRSGGARPGAGRPPKEPSPPPAGADTPLAFLLAVMNDPSQEPALRVRAAVAAAQYVHMKKGDGGKKDEEREAAKKAGAGKFAAAPAPLKLVNR